MAARYSRDSLSTEVKESPRLLKNRVYSQVLEIFIQHYSKWCTLSFDPETLDQGVIFEYCCYNWKASVKRKLRTKDENQLKVVHINLPVNPLMYKTKELTDLSNDQFFEFVTQQVQILVPDKQIKSIKLVQFELAVIKFVDKTIIEFRWVFKYPESVTDKIPEEYARQEARKDELKAFWNSLRDKNKEEQG